MKKARELDFKDCKKFFTKADVKISKKLMNEDLIIGQERGVDAILFALKMKNSAYNLYVSGEPGTGKTSFSKLSAEKIAQTEPVPADFCYVYNFEDPKSPTALSFEAGWGIKFKEDMSEFSEIAKIELAQAFANEDYHSERTKIFAGFEEQKRLLIDELSIEANDCDFVLKISSSGIFFMPVVDGKTLNEEDYDKLDEKDKKEIEKKSEIVKIKAAEVMRESKILDKKSAEEIKNLNYKTGLFAIAHSFDELFAKYCESKKVAKYLENIKEDMLESIDFFIDSDKEESDNIPGGLAFLPKQDGDCVFKNYSVNLIVDNKDRTSAPVVVDFNPTYQNLLGEMEFDSEYGNFQTDFMKIKPGLLHKANGGYLILQAQDLFSNPNSWDALRLALLTNTIEVDNLKRQGQNLNLSSLSPEAIPCNVKIIIIGSPFYYYMLSMNDEIFSKKFKIFADFDVTMPSSKGNITMMSTFLQKFCKENSLPSITEQGCIKLLEYSAQLAEDKEKLTTKFGQLADVLFEASALSRFENGKDEELGHFCIEKAIQARRRRHSLYEENCKKLYGDEIILVQLFGTAPAQINALTLVSTATDSFSLVARVTASSYIGELGIINIEKESDLSGSTHSKGVHILSGYLGNNFAQDFPLCLTAGICFEQSYGGIDGDSASAAELFAILSSLSEIGIRQDLAVTGSVNQHGQIQAVGGVSLKIAGFFDLCEAKGLSGTQGVIIPAQNVKELMLDDKVVEAVKNGLFHIYPIHTVKEGIEILFGTEYETVHSLVYEKLKSYHSRMSKKPQS